MNIDVLLTPLEICPERVSGRVAVVIDVFRATSCICTAFANGARRLIPVTTVEGAWALHEKLAVGDRVLLGGERHTRLIEGFDLDNSPFSYSRERVEGATIVMSTTNGTRALEGCVEAGAAAVLVGALVNAAAAATEAGARGKDIVVVCAGRKDRYTTEDVLAAGMIAGLIAEGHTAELTDAAYCARTLYNNSATDLRGFLQAGCTHYRQIVAGGLADDVAYCLERNILEVVPELDFGEGSIRG